MSRPTKVLAFLDVSGAWDPSLAFVMAGALGVHFLAVVTAKRRGRTALGGIFHWPKPAAIDKIAGMTARHLSARRAAAGASGTS